MNPWRMGIDTGGTFTDCIAVDPGGRAHRVKVLSSGRIRGRVRAVRSATSLLIEERDWVGPAAVGMRLARSGDPYPRVIRCERTGEGCILEFDAPVHLLAMNQFELTADEEAPVLAARIAVGLPPGAELPPIAMRLGTTRGTNALLEERGDRVGLFITEGFGDLPEIGDQQRPDIFSLRIVKARPLHAAVVEVPGRMDASGRELRTLDLEAVRRGGRRLLESGIRTACIALMHAWIDPSHEIAVERTLREMGFTHCSRSADLAPMIRLLPRLQTATVNAYLAAVIEGYISRVRAALGPRSTLHLMTSGGGLAHELRPKDSLLSGPAGGVVGAAAAGRAAGHSRLIAFDMGGTSTDVSRIDGGFEYDFEHRVGAARILSPAISIESVAAGGGSVCESVDGQLRVGPRSAGAAPGPACYGAGGPLTITDCNLLLGRLDPSGFGIPVEEGPARTRLGELLAVHHAAESPEEILESLVSIADDRMAGAIARISTRRGYDPASHALLCFGGAGGQHACGVASRLRIATVIVPADAGLLSAAGLLQAPIERLAQRQVLRTLADLGDSLGPMVRDLTDQAGREVAAEGARAEEFQTFVDLRLLGQDAAISISWDGDSPLENLFERRFRAQYGHRPPARPVEVVAVRVMARSRVGAAAPRTDTEVKGSARDLRRQSWFGGRWHEATIVRRSELRTGEPISGPALVLDPHSTTVLPPGWTGRLDESGALILTASTPPPPPPPSARDELSTGRLLSIARDMGHMLERTALSTNVKERLDFSCAILDGSGRLIANAPHIPVHLGSMGVCVRRVLEQTTFHPGDVVMTNHPGFGGSHLPDITVITPVFLAGNAPAAFVACRAHHAELGGTRPGSMPTDARSLVEEGVVIPPFHLVHRGIARLDETRALLLGAKFPTRAIEENLADLAAQVAANQHGAAALGSFDGGPRELARAMDSLTDRAARGARRALIRLRGRSFSAEEFLDNGSPLRVCIDAPAEGPIVVDFSGSAPIHPGNLNSTPAIVRSVVMYVIRLMIDDDLPLNEGLLNDVDIRLPEGMLNPSFPPELADCPAVAGGNTETSQRLVGLLLKALGLSASSQGTMNNLLFGTSTFGYYETICGGAGAGPGFDGASAVHTHMTNTRITDPEVLERRYPVRLERFSIRPQSGGRGKFRGGDGAVRELVFLAPCSLSVLSQHRTRGPFGLGGGSPGLPGLQRLLRADGRAEHLGSIDGREVEPGDRLILETPGGGGWGRPDPG